MHKIDRILCTYYTQEIWQKQEIKTWINYAKILKYTYEIFKNIYIQNNKRLRKKGESIFQEFEIKQSLV